MVLAEQRGRSFPTPQGQITPQMFIGAPSLNFNNFSVAPNLFGRSLRATDVQDGSWALGFKNTAGGSTNYAVVTTQSIANAVSIPHPTNVSISGSGNAPTFSWTLLANVPQLMRYASSCGTIRGMSGSGSPAWGRRYRGCNLCVESDTAEPDLIHAASHAAATQRLVFAGDQPG